MCTSASLWFWQHSGVRDGSVIDGEITGGWGGGDGCHGERSQHHQMEYSSRSKSMATGSAGRQASIKASHLDLWHVLWGAWEVLFLEGTQFPTLHHPIPLYHPYCTTRKAWMVIADFVAFVSVGSGSSPTVVHRMGRILIRMCVSHDSLCSRLTRLDPDRKTSHTLFTTSPN